MASAVVICATFFLIFEIFLLQLLLITFLVWMTVSMMVWSPFRFPVLHITWLVRSFIQPIVIFLFIPRPFPVMASNDSGHRWFLTIHCLLTTAILNFTVRLLTLLGNWRPLRIIYKVFLSHDNYFFEPWAEVSYWLHFNWGVPLFWERISVLPGCNNLWSFIKSSKIIFVFHGISLLPSSNPSFPRTWRRTRFVVQGVTIADNGGQGTAQIHR